MDRANVEEIAARAETLHRLAQELFETSEDFPAVNRNAKRVLAAIEILQLNVETASE